MMKLTTRAILGLTAATVVIAGGVVSVTAVAGAADVPYVFAVPAIDDPMTVDPTDASTAIGVAPSVDSPVSNDPPSMLGTVFTFHWADTEVQVQATSVSTTTKTAATRTITTIVNYTAVTGTASYAPSDFVILDQNRTRYNVSTDSTTRQLGSGTLSPGQTTEGTLDFEVPTKAAALVIAYVPAPNHNVVGAWMLSAP